MTSEKVFYETVRSGMETVLGNPYVCEVQQIVKVNMTLDGLIIHEQGNNVSPTIYLNQYFGEYQSGKRMDEIIQEILLVYESTRHGKKVFGAKDMFDYDHIRKNVILKVINTERNIDLLRTVPHVRMDGLGLSAIFYVPVQLDSEAVAGFMIQNRHMELWKLHMEELLNDAKRNMKEKIQFVVRSMEEILMNDFNENIEGVPEGASGMYVLSDEPTRRFGASCMFQKDAIAKFANAKECDLIILPSSICELILLPADLPAIDVFDLQKMVHAVNQEQVVPEEFLSDDVFKYIRSEDKIVKL